MGGVPLAQISALGLGGAFGDQLERVQSGFKLLGQR